ncbi:MAG: hypothetical protein MJZ86_10705 [Bacteroidales bacterium]|nr:hypothetical protein [Bacteroidales bacterium]
MEGSTFFFVLSSSLSRDKQNIYNMEMLEVRTIIGIMKSTFDSHDFINAFALTYPASYLGMLRMYHEVKYADSQIGLFLGKNQNSLSIAKVGEQESENILGNITPCALWRKIQ